MDGAEKMERLVEAAAAVLNAAPSHRLNVVVLNKVLFYLDLASLRDRASTITGNTFLGIQQGPVVAKYPQRLIGQLETRGIAKQISDWDGSKPVLLESSPNHIRFLDADAMTLVSAVTNWFAPKTSSQVSEFSHENPGWQLAWATYRRTGKPSPINMRIAMQQIVEDDPWMDMPLLDHADILAEADAGAGVDW
jgi:hypothetical protein